MTRLGDVNNTPDGKGKVIFIAMLAVVLLFVSISLVAGAYLIYNKAVSEDSGIQASTSPKSHSTTTRTSTTTTTTIAVNKPITSSAIKPKTTPCNSPSVCMSSQSQCTGTFTKQNCGVDSSDGQGCCYITAANTPTGSNENVEFSVSPYKCDKFNLGFFDRWLPPEKR